jgi:acyl carrier protein
MKKEKIINTGRKIIADSLGLPIEECLDEMDLKDDLGADSLDAVEIIMAVETKFDIAIGEGEADNINTVKDLLDKLVEKVKADD